MDNIVCVYIYIYTADYPTIHIIVPLFTLFQDCPNINGSSSQAGAKRFYAIGAFTIRLGKTRPLDILGIFVLIKCVGEFGI